MKDELLRQLTTVDFIGGTLVEYEIYGGFGIEWGRGTVLKVNKPTEGSIEFETDGEARMGLNLEEYSPSVQNKDGVYYIDVPILSICFALAPKGVEIPKP